MTNYFVTKNDTTRMALIHLEECANRKGAGERQASFEEAVENGWGDGVRCVRYCGDCWSKVTSLDEIRCLCPRV